jgi:predicted AAA+ superfamily ATPase
MIKRNLENQLLKAMETMPVVALLGPRQVGKTTLALEIAKIISKESTYLDLELDTDLAKLSDAEAYLSRFQNKLLIIDEVQRQPNLFPLLRGLVDRRKRAGEKAGQFLLLDSASRDLLQHSSETLAGRIRFLELSPFSALEIFLHEPTSFDQEKRLATRWISR